MQEILFLLLPLAFYSGWKAARKKQKKDQIPRTDSAASPHFVRGINFLLNEEPDKALDIFLESPAIDAQIADTFLSLGNMFRNRGEVNRALRVHQHLVARPDLSREQRQAAMLALGEDFFAAGLLDRAESVFREVIDKYPDNAGVSDPLRHIYEQLQDWDKAIALSQRATSFPNDKNRFIAHYYCEQAEEHLRGSELYQADESLKSALAAYPESARVKVLQARLALARNDRKQALSFYQQAIKKDQRLLGMLIDELLKVFTADAELKQLYQFVHDEYLESNNVRLFPALLSIACSTGNEQAVCALIESHLRNDPLSLQTITRSVAILADQSLVTTDATENSATDARILPTIQAALERLSKGDAHFQCVQCGYKMNDYLWRCPACHHWDTIQNT
ncbi:MAG: Heat shock (predicted periplasmic) protein YciM, precursor [uncultured Thiotrichaceae bacterium]|uniref:Heat shock (Predicted periplasmic) protein YciM n=1 Tax=uncultured Thiotrichaceae bacterium TaxID=298394 RepID=A0A6S6U0D3_9GAMM|nr:MAG: Heat shock (predicted periplasmic) protein YciM, precursor [uncultured Thiotrichaceae bacterium]